MLDQRNRRSRERWHFTNASSGRYFDLELLGHAFTVIGTDGGLLEKAYETATLRIAPGKRYDMLVSLTGPTGSERALVTRPVDRGVENADRVTRTVLTLRFEGSSQPPALDPALPVGRVERIPIDEATRVERFELGVDLKPLVGDEPRYSINDQYFPFADMHQEPSRLTDGPRESVDYGAIRTILPADGMSSTIANRM